MSLEARCRDALLFRLLSTRMHDPSPFEHPARSPEGAATARPERSLAGVRAALEPLAVAHGVSLVDVIWTTERSGRTLRVTIERPGAGPTTSGFGVNVDDCAEFSRDASSTLDLIEGLDQSYSLEVSSPGLDRPLRSIEDFKRFTGELAKVKLHEPASDGQRLLRGTIEAVTGDRITMRVDGKAHVVAHDAIDSAQLTFELAHGEKKKSTGGRTKKSRLKKSGK